MSNFNIEVRLWDPRPGEENVSGFITLNGGFRCDFTLRNGKNGQFLSFPSYKKKDGTWQETAGPTNKDVRTAITNAVIQAAQERSGGGTAQQKQQNVEQARSDTRTSVPTSMPF